MNALYFECVGERLKRELKSVSARFCGFIVPKSAVISFYLSWRISIGLAHGPTRETYYIMTAEQLSLAVSMCVKGLGSRESAASWPHLLRAGVIQ